MSKSGPIVLVEDDQDDKEIFETILEDLNIKNKFVWFRESESAFDYLSTTSESVFLIFCDINMPGFTGLEFKRNIDGDPELRKKSIPFVFFSTFASQKAIDEAYIKMTIQGFFEKPSKYDEVKTLIKLILDYWKYCKHPNS